MHKNVLILSIGVCTLLGCTAVDSLTSFTCTTDEDCGEGNHCVQQICAIGDPTSGQLDGQMVSSNQADASVAEDAVDCRGAADACASDQRCEMNSAGNYECVETNMSDGGSDDELVTAGASGNAGDSAGGNPDDGLMGGDAGQTEDDNAGSGGTGGSDGAGGSESAGGSQEESGVGGNADEVDGTNGKVCSQSSQCDSGACIVYSDRAICAPTSDRCIPACRDGQACVATTTGNLCLTTIEGEMQDGNGGILPVGGNVDGDLFGDDPADEDDTSNDVPSDTVDSCEPLFECFDECASDDQNCVQACIDNGGLAGERFLAWRSCREGAGCILEDGSLDTVCAYESCAAEIEACYAFDIPEGNDSCSGYIACLGTCLDGEDDCFEACYFQTSAEGMAQYSDVVWCSDAAGCFDVEDAELREFCIEQNCASEVEACFGPVVQPLGDDDCFSLSACMERCAVDDRFCIGDCVEASSPEGLADRQAFETCVSFATDGTGNICQDIACIETACEEEVALCYPNGRLPWENTEEPERDFICGAVRWEK